MGSDLGRLAATGGLDATGTAGGLGCRGTLSPEVTTVGLDIEVWKEHLAGLESLSEEERRANVEKLNALETAQ